MKFKGALLGAVLAGAALVAIPASIAMAGQAAQPTGPVHPAANPKGNYGQLDSLPDWGGVWIVTNQRPAGAPPREQPVAKGKYKEELERIRAFAAANNGLVPQKVSDCTPPGMPLMMGTGQYPFEFLITPGRVTVLAEAWTGERRIYTDGRGHPPADELDPTYSGSSIGRWEGDTLVVETIGLKDSNEIATGLTHSGKMKVTERIRLDPNNPNQLVDTITVSDEDAIEKPFTYEVRYNRRRDTELMEFVCAENDRNPIGPDGLVQFNH